MTFTNDNLKRLKEKNAKPRWRIMLRQEEMQALLARLEAAEALIPYSNWYEPNSIEDEKEWREKTQVWRKAAGK